MKFAMKLVAASALALAAQFGVAQAEGFPERPITMIVPFGAGTSTDLVARVIGEGMSANLGQPIVIENRAGAGGSIGTQEVVKAASDGYTLSMGTVGTLAINESLYPDLPYDSRKDITPLSFIGYTPTLLVVKADGPYKALDDLIKASKTKDGVTFASAGNGTSGHLAGEKLKVETGGRMIHVPFSSGAEGLTAVLSGEVDFMFYHPVAALPNIKAGKMVALGVSGAKGSVVVPESPPIALSIKGFDLIAWWLVAGPAGMPEDVVARLREALHASLQSDAVREHFKRTGIQFGDVADHQLDAFIQQEVQQWGAIVEASKAQVD